MNAGGGGRQASTRVLRNIAIHSDLERIRGKAIAVGADTAEIIPVSYISVEERVRLKCLVPRCPKVGASPYCPPHTPEPAFVRRAFSQYQWAVMFKKDLYPLESFVRMSPDCSYTETMKAYFVEMFNIVGSTEAYAQSIGYDLAIGFGGGSCNTTLCNSSPCAVMKGQSCRHPLKARPSMEAVGIDVFGLAEKIGWKIYMIRHIEPELRAIPSAVSVGIVLVF